MKRTKGCKSDLSFRWGIQFDVTYDRYDRYVGSNEEPPTPAEVEVTRVVVTIGEARVEIRPNDLGEELMEKICDSLLDGEDNGN